MSLFSVNLIQYTHRLQMRLNRKLFMLLWNHDAPVCLTSVLRKLSLDKTKSFLSELGRKVCYRNLLGSAQRF